MTCSEICSEDNDDDDDDVSMNSDVRKTAALNSIRIVITREDLMAARVVVAVHRNRYQAIVVVIR